MAGISSLGVGSGIDIRGLVDQLLAAERAPVETRLARRETTLQAELSSFGTLKSALSAFSDTVARLSEASAFRSARATSSDPEAIEVVGSSEVRSAASFGIQVDALAQAQSLASVAFAGPTADVGAGSITFRFGTLTVDGDGAVVDFLDNPERGSATIVIPPEAATLGDVRDAVNQAEIGIRASIINDGSGERLVFSATETGSANGFLVEIDDADGQLDDGAGLSRLRYDQAGGDLLLNRLGGDARLVVDGLPVTRPGNEISDLLESATLTLRGTSATPVDVQVEPDVGKARALIDSFVEGYNELQKQIESVAGYDADTQQGGILQGNALVRSVESNMRRLVTQQIDALDGQSVRALADIGIRTTRDGLLEVDETRLSERLADSLDEIGALFGTGGLVDGTGMRYESAGSQTRPGRYGVVVTSVSEPALLAGVSVSEATPSNPVGIRGSSDEFELSVNGVASGPITLTRGDYTSAAALALELQTRINETAAFDTAGIEVEVEFDSAGSRFLLRTVENGAETSLELTSADPGFDDVFGLTAGQSDSGSDVSGTIGGVQAEFDGRFLTAQTGDAAGLKVEIIGSATGPLGSVTFSRGVSSLLEQAIEAFLDSDGPFSGATKSRTEGIDEIADERIELDERLALLETRLVAQFSAMDALVSQLNQTSSFLTSQLSGLEALARNGGRSNRN